VPLNRSRLYTLILSACLAGYIWLFYISTSLHSERSPVEVCLIKRFTNIPCPSCGSTRSIFSLIHGDFQQAVYINPIGLIVAVIMLLTPIWIFVDLLLKRTTLFDLFQQTESFLKKPKVAIPIVLLMLTNWLWNITKGL
jgi:hypothetical protein